MANGPTTKEVHKLQDKLTHNVEEELQLSSSYILLLTFSVIIAALGMLIDSTAVVIGAMLISPLFWPIMGITLSLFRARQAITRQSVRLLLISIGIAIAVSALVGWIVPIDEISSEILARTQPTIIDLIIALATSVIGVMAIFYPRISASATGVAISIALLPPLTVSGLGIAFWSWDMFYRSLLLFGTNVVAMIFAGIVTLYFLHFRPRRKKEETRLRIGFISSFISLIILAIPLSLYLRATLQRDATEERVSHTLEQEITNISSDARVDDITVQFFSRSGGEMSVQATMYAPEGVFLTEAQQGTIIDALSATAEQTVNLDLDVVSTVQLRQEEDVELREKRTNLEEFITAEVHAMNPEALIESISINNLRDETIPVEVLLSLRQVDDVPLRFEQKEQLQEKLSAFVDQEIAIEVEFIPVERLNRPDELARAQDRATTVIIQGFSEINQAINVEKVAVELAENEEVYNVTATIRAPQQLEVTETQTATIENNVSTELGLPVTLEVFIFRFDQPTADQEEDSST